MSVHMPYRMHTDSQNHSNSILVHAILVLSDRASMHASLATQHPPHRHNNIPQQASATRAPSLAMASTLSSNCSVSETSFATAVPQGYPI